MSSKNEIPKDHILRRLQEKLGGAVPYPYEHLLHLIEDEKTQPECTCDKYEEQKQRALCPVCDKEEYERIRKDFDKLKEPVDKEQKADIEQEATIEFNLLPESEDTFKEGYTVATKKYTASLKQKDEDISALDKVIIGHESTICDKDEEIARLEQWKREAIEVDFDRQEVGRLLQIPLGQSIHDKIIPGIKRLQQEVERLNKQLNAKNIECDKLKERLSASQFAHGKCLTQLSQSFTVEEISKAYEEWEFNDSIDIPFTEYLTNLKDKKEGKV